MIVHYIACVFGGLFLCNCIPHLAAGLRGERFPSPFAKPPGKGLSSSVVNFLWGAFNLGAGLALLLGIRYAPGWNAETAVAAGAFVLAGVSMSRGFEKVRQGREKDDGSNG
jgi:hypothetical protein